MKQGINSKGFHVPAGCIVDYGFSRGVGFHYIACKKTRRSRRLSEAEYRRMFDDEQFCAEMFREVTVEGDFTDDNKCTTNSTFAEYSKRKVAAGEQQITMKNLDWLIERLRIWAKGSRPDFCGEVNFKVHRGRIAHLRMAEDSLAPGEKEETKRR